MGSLRSRRMNNSNASHRTLRGRPREYLVAGHRMEFPCGCAPETGFAGERTCGPETTGGVTIPCVVRLLEVIAVEEHPTLELHPLVLNRFLHLRQRPFLQVLPTGSYLHNRALALEVLCLQSLRIEDDVDVDEIG